MVTLVRTTIPYPLIWDSGTVDVVVNGENVQVLFNREYKGGSNNVEIKYDRLERVSRTNLELRLPISTSDRDVLIEYVHAVVNRLIQVYRFTTNEFHLDSIPRYEMNTFDVSTLDEDGVISPVMSHMENFGYGIGIARHAPISEEAIVLLQNGEEPPVHQMLYLNSRRQELYENFRLAVVESETAFEVLVDEVITNHYRRDGKSESEIDGILNAGLRNLIRDHLPICCGEPFEGTPEHDAWEDDLYGLRNRIIHDGASVNADEAKAALDAAAKALKWLSSRTA